MRRRIHMRRRMHAEVATTQTYIHKSPKSARLLALVQKATSAA